MTNEEFRKIDLHGATNTELTHLFDIVHAFSQAIIATQSEKDIFNILANNVSRQMLFGDCVIYKVDKQKKLLKRVAAFGTTKTSEEEKEISELKFGEGHVGMVVESGQTLLISDVSKSNQYYFDTVQAGSELIVPVKIQNKVYAIISSEHPEKGFYREIHQKLLEVIASIVAGAMAKIHKKEELQKIKVKLEDVIEKKSADLDKAIETLSSQFTEMRNYQNKQEELIQEVHHRVANNLQVISSILRLYVNGKAKNSSTSLQEVHNRIQIMALIHQNIYRSMETNLVNFNSYLDDLFSYLKSTSKNVKVETNYQAEIEFLSLDMLVPLGLYITEAFYLWTNLMKEHGLTQSSFNLQFKCSKETFLFEVFMEDSAKIALLNEIDIHQSEEMNCILISALVEQLDGDLELGFVENNFIGLKFKYLNRNI